MEIIRLILLLLSAASSLYCLPSRTLNDRSTELAWQAWLLVDDQNQHRQQNDPNDGILRRRITPKSVFIAPTFSPESLPACADGYRPDSMGRCIKIIKLDEAAHLDFLLQKLNEKFGGFGGGGDEDEGDSDEDSSQDEEEATKGPFQLNIPLGEMETNVNDEDIAIIVAPTNNAAAAAAEMEKVEKVKRTQNSGANDDSNLLMSVLGIPSKDYSKQVTETTTLEASTVSTTLPTTMVTDQVPVTSWKKQTETQPPPTQTSTLFASTTTNPPQTSTIPVETTPTTLEASTSTTFTSQTVETTTEYALPQSEQLVEQTTNAEDSLHALFYLEPKNTTATEEAAAAENFQVAVASNNNEQLAPGSPATGGGIGAISYVKFPDDREYPHNKEYIRFPLQSEGVYNHRNRDKHMSFWPTVPPANSNRAGQSLSIRDDASSFGNPEAIYRRLESGELSYLFGNTRNRRNR